MTKKMKMRAGLAKALSIAAVALALDLGYAVLAQAGPAEDASAAHQRGDYGEAYRLWRELAKAGDAEAQFNLGLAYFKGEHILQDYDEAMGWLLAAGSQGQLGAQHQLGFMYENGYGVPVNLIEAHKWFNLATVHNDNRFAVFSAVDRERVAARMSRADVMEAQKRAREWNPVKAKR